MVGEIPPPSLTPLSRFHRKRIKRISLKFAFLGVGALPNFCRISGILFFLFRAGAAAAAGYV